MNAVEETTEVVQPAKRKRDDSVDESDTINKKQCNNDESNNSSSNNNSSSSSNESTAVSTGGLGFGFGSYAKSNPFLAAASKGNGLFGKPIAAANASNSSINNVSSFTNGVMNVRNPPITAPPAILIPPSPKSPKNPFASTSPSLNPFMKIVDSKDDPWNSVTSKISSKDSASDSLFQNEQLSPKITQEVSVTNADTNCDENSNDENDDTNDISAAPIVYKIYQFPENVEIKTGEEDEVCELLLRVKLFRLSLPPTVDNTSASTEPTTSSESSSMLLNALSKSNASSTAVSRGNNEPQWIEVGTGPLKLLKSGNRYRLVVRREEKKGGCGIKVIFNALLKKYVKIEKINDKMLKLVCINVIADSAPSVDESADKAKLLPATFLLKTQLPSEADDLYNKIYAIIQQFHDSTEKVA